MFLHHVRFTSISVLTSEATNIIQRRAFYRNAGYTSAVRAVSERPRRTQARSNSLRTRRFFRRYSGRGFLWIGFPASDTKKAGFYCSFRDLSLDDAAELKASGLPTTVDIEDADPEDFYPEPDY